MENKTPTAEELMEALGRRLKRAAASTSKKRLATGEYIEVDGNILPNPDHENYYKYRPEETESIISDADAAKLVAGESIKVLTESGNYITISATKE